MGRDDTDKTTKFKRPMTAQEAVLQELRRAIVNHEIEPGQRIHQESLAQGLGVSRVPLREALRTLEAEGLAINKPNRGYYVAQLTVSELEEIYLLRRLLEDEMDRRAVENINEASIERLEALIEEMDEAAEAHDIRRFTALNKEFHFTIFERAQLPRFLRMTEVLWQSSEAYRSMYLSDPEMLLRVREGHLSIVDACRNSETEALIEHSDRHRRAAVTRLLKVLDGSLSD